MVFAMPFGSDLSSSKAKQIRFIISVIEPSRYFLPLDMLSLDLTFFVNVMLRDIMFCLGTEPDSYNFIVQASNSSIVVLNSLIPHLI
jgi:hypothetical protein